MGVFVGGVGLVGVVGFTLCGFGVGVGKLVKLISVALEPVGLSVDAFRVWFCAVFWCGVGFGCVGVV